MLDDVSGVLLRSSTIKLPWEWFENGEMHGRSMQFRFATTELNGS